MIPRNVLTDYGHVFRELMDSRHPERMLSEFKASGLVFVTEYMEQIIQDSIRETERFIYTLKQRHPGEPDEETGVSDLKLKVDRMRFIMELFQEPAQEPVQEPPEAGLTSREAALVLIYRKAKIKPGSPDIIEAAKEFNKTVKKLYDYALQYDREINRVNSNGSYARDKNHLKRLENVIQYLENEENARDYARGELIEFQKIMKNMYREI